MADGVLITLTVTTELHEVPEAVNVMLAAPAKWPVTMPVVAPTEAVSGADDNQVPEEGEAVSVVE